jgi:hypothetical protein
LTGRWQRGATLARALSLTGLLLSAGPPWSSSLSASPPGASSLCASPPAGSPARASPAGSPLCAQAAASEIVTIGAGFSPMRLGAPTTVSFGFTIRASDGGLPSALTGIDFHYPRQLNLAASELGQATCNPTRLQELGPTACPPNSIMGSGTAQAKFQVSPIVSHENANIALVAGPSRGGYVNVLIAASGEYPVETRIVMSTLLLPGRFHIAVPLVPGIPEGPPVAVVKVKAVLGGRLTYYERRHGRRTPYRPSGVLLPRHCPRGGFRFSATFSFLDGTRASATTTVRCVTTTSPESVA